MSERRSRRMPVSLVAGLAMLGILVVLAVIAPLIWGTAATTVTPDTRLGPSPLHLMGTDDLGRDVLARTLVATRLTLLMAAAATIGSVVLGVLIGGLVWVGSRRVREWVLRIVDSTVAFPSLVLALVIAAILGAGMVPAIIAIAIAGVPSFARITSNMTGAVATRDYVGTARLLGVPRLALFFRHLLPNISGPLLVLIASSFALTLLDISSLSFVGLGVQSPDFDWGRLLNEGLPAVYDQPLQVVGPAVMLVFAGVAAMLTGDGLATWLDPRSARRGQVKGLRSTPRGTSMSPEALVEVRDLTVRAPSGKMLVDGISFDIAPGEILGLVGESGSGKSMTAMALARLQADGVVVDASVLRLGDLDLLSNRHRGRLAKEIGLVYQDPGSTFNPALRMSAQLTEVARVHLGLSRRAAKATLIDGLTDMRIRDPKTVMDQHPFQLSGGMLQRATIASSLVTDPKLLIADEPTTALDVTVQAEVLRALRKLNQDHGTAVLFISHDIGVVEALCDRVLVMRSGEIVERLDVDALQRREVQHPYTRALLEATPTLTITPRPLEESPRV
ncbi:dipeptide/oligopeptide/nickel ABC transporter permease/ATP-binding protein [Microbacterium oleivorans]|uniref:dipeptide/oligopeptide/nickel ABC transporter permease/ATP-binding protein n=1 Tax=Microbacterium oleivorans TaxID=273677 RepID=UPI0010A4FF6C|nr:dipeptide/oligopeptide/nickel ABC transporter permease/ATP-binding protein [Microbacterium oleivorans]THE07697.1 dipeptide/oligopeptide/nickel ABC transporter permease/ATP-binding protein [Microbacterium oleivorans]